MQAALGQTEDLDSISQSDQSNRGRARTESPKHAEGKKGDHSPIKLPNNHGSPRTNHVAKDRLSWGFLVRPLHRSRVMKRWILAFNLVITAMTPTTTFNLCGDQPTATDGSIILIMKGMPWVVIPGPKKSTVVASIRMTVVIENTNMCPGEFNNDPLELQGIELSECPNVRRGNENTRLTGVS